MNRKWTIVFLFGMLLLLLYFVFVDVKIRQDNTSLVQNMEEAMTLNIKLQDTIIQIKVQFKEREKILKDSIVKTRKFVEANLPRTVIVTFISEPETNNSEYTSELHEKMIGTWQLCHVADSSRVTNYAGTKDLRRYKLITPTSFSNADFFGESKLLLPIMLGNYTVENDIYSEFIQFSGRDYESYLNQSNGFKVIIDDNYMSIIPVSNNPYAHEVWERIKY